MKLWPASSSGVQKRWSDAEGDWCERITRCHSCPLHTHTHTHTHIHLWRHTYKEPVSRCKPKKSETMEHDRDTDVGLILTLPNGILGPEFVLDKINNEYLRKE